MPYASVTVLGYNANPPPDDGTAVTENEVSWSKHKEKIGDPLKTAIDSMQIAIDAVVSDIETDVATNLASINTLDANIIEGGTVMLFQQVAAPTSWTKLTTNNDKALRIVSGVTGGTAGGTTAFSGVFAARTILQANIPSYTLSDTLTLPNHGHSDSFTLPNHAHADTIALSGSGSSVTRNFSVSSDVTLANVAAGSGENVNGTKKSRINFSSTTLSTSGSVGNPTSNPGINGSVGNPTSNPSIDGSVTSGGSGTAMDFAVQYVDVIAASKDAF